MVALERDLLVELFEQLRDGRVRVGLDMPHESELWKAVATHDKAQAHVLISHVEGDGDGP